MSHLEITGREAQIIVSAQREITAILNFVISKVNKPANIDDIKTRMDAVGAKINELSNINALKQNQHFIKAQNQLAAFSEILNSTEKEKRLKLQEHAAEIFEAFRELNRELPKPGIGAFFERIFR